MRLPDEPTTPEQWEVILWGAIVVLFLLGAVGIYFSFGAAPAKAALTSRVRNIGLMCWGLAGVVYGAKRIIARVID